MIELTILFLLHIRYKLRCKEALVDLSNKIDENRIQVCSNDQPPTLNCCYVFVLPTVT